MVLTYTHGRIAGHTRKVKTQTVFSIRGTSNAKFPKRPVNLFFRRIAVVSRRRCVNKSDSLKNAGTSRLEMYVERVTLETRSIGREGGDAK